LNDNKFIFLLKTLNKKEFKSFTNYLNCFYKTRKKDLAVFEVVASPQKAFNPKRINLSPTIMARFKKMGVSEKNLSNNHLFNLGTYLEEFLVWQKFKNKVDDFEKDKLLLAIYKERNIDNLYENKYNSLKSSLKEAPVNMWSFLKLFVLDYEKYFSAPNDKKTIKGEEMKEVLESLDGFFVSAKLKISIEQYFRKNIFGKDLEIQLLQECLVLADKLPIFQNNLSIQVFKYIINLKNDPNLTDYLQLKKLIFEHPYIEEQNDRGLYIAFLINYVASELKRGQLTYISEYKECVEYALEKRFFFEGDYINTTVFHNWVNIASVGLKEVQYAKEIIQKYRPYLRPSDEENALKIAQAYLFLAEKDFTKIINSLVPNKISNRFMNLRARLILIMAYYENREYERLLKFIEASIKSVKNAPNLGSNNKKSALNTFKYTSKLFDNIYANQFRNEVNDLEFIFNKSWLLEKIS